MTRRRGDAVTRIILILKTFLKIIGGKEHAVSGTRGVRNVVHANDILLASDTEFVNKGATSEMFAGLELEKAHDCFVKPEMFYWQNTDKGAQGEIDYLTVVDGHIIPIEVKAGTKGKMQSLYNFMPKHSSAYGIRTSLENVSSYDHNGCHIKVVPLYSLTEILSLTY